MSAGQYLDIPSIARTVLAGVVTHFAASSVTLPDRQVIAPGEPRQIAWDCSEVIVSCGGIIWGSGPGSGAGIGRSTGNPVSAGARYTVIAVQVVRCVPEHDGTDPPPDDVLTAAGIALLTDAGLLSQALVELCGTQGALKRAGMAIAGDVALIGPSGGYAATEGLVTITAGTLV